MIIVTDVLIVGAGPVVDRRFLVTTASGQAFDVGRRHHDGQNCPKKMSEYVASIPAFELIGA
jgi:hypothetical protein